MGRPLEFDRTEAVVQAVDMFWREGYRSLSANDLADGMGLAKSSLYNTFGSKRDLFIESVDHYAERQRAKVLAIAKNADVVGQLSRMLLEIARNNNSGRGCLLVNAATEMGSRDRDVRQHVKVGFDGMARSFEALIRAGQARGHVNSELNPQTYAITLVAGIAGLRVLAKSGFSEDLLLPFVETLLAGLSK